MSQRFYQQKKLSPGNQEGSKTEKPDSQSNWRVSDSVMEKSRGGDSWKLHSVQGRESWNDVADLRMNTRVEFPIFPEEVTTQPQSSWQTRWFSALPSTTHSTHSNCRFHFDSQDSFAQSLETLFMEQSEAASCETLHGDGKDEQVLAQSPHSGSLQQLQQQQPIVPAMSQDCSPRAQKESFAQLDYHPSLVGSKRMISSLSVATPCFPNSGLACEYPDASVSPKYPARSTVPDSPIPSLEIKPFASFAGEKENTDEKESAGTSAEQRQEHFIGWQEDPEQDYELKESSAVDEDASFPMNKKKRSYFRKCKHPKEVVERFLEQKRKEKRERNRILAAESRRRQKEEMLSLKTEKTGLVKKLDRAMQEIAALKKELELLKTYQGGRSFKHLLPDEQAEATTC